MHQTIWRTLYLIGLCLAIGFGCSTAHMAMPKDLPASTTVLPVLGKKAFSFDESFHFGDYAVTQVRRGWTRSTAWSFMGFKSAKARQQYEFTLRPAAGGEWKAHCATGVKWKEMEFDNFLNTKGQLTWGIKSDLVFACTFEPAEGSPWKLVMGQGTDEMVMNGVLTDGQVEIAVEGIRELAGTSWPLMEPAGYSFRGPAGLLGAVEVLNTGEVRLASEIPAGQKDALACASSALLLFRQIKK